MSFNLGHYSDKIKRKVGRLRLKDEYSVGECLHYVELYANTTETNRLLYKAIRNSNGNTSHKQISRRPLDDDIHNYHDAPQRCTKTVQRAINYLCKQEFNGKKILTKVKDTRKDEDGKVISIFKYSTELAENEVKLVLYLMDLASQHHRLNSRRTQDRLRKKHETMKNCGRRIEYNYSQPSKVAPCTKCPPFHIYKKKPNKLGIPSECNSIFKERKGDYLENVSPHLKINDYKGQSGRRVWGKVSTKMVIPVEIIDYLAESSGVNQVTAIKAMNDSIAYYVDQGYYLKNIPVTLLKNASKTCAKVKKFEGMRKASPKNRWRKFFFYQDKREFSTRKEQEALHYERKRQDRIAHSQVSEVKAPMLSKLEYQEKKLLMIKDMVDKGEVNGDDTIAIDYFMNNVDISAWEQPKTLATLATCSTVKQFMEVSDMSDDRYEYKAARHVDWNSPKDVTDYKHVSDAEMKEYGLHQGTRRYELYKTLRKLNQLHKFDELSKYAG